MDGEGMLCSPIRTIFTALRLSPFLFGWGLGECLHVPWGKNDLPAIHVNYGWILGSRQTLG